MKPIFLKYALATLLCAGACTTTAPHMNNNQDIQGTWECVSAIVNGRELPREIVVLLRLTLTRDRYKTEKGSEVLFDSTYTIDGSKTPGQINMVGTEGDLKGKEAQGIYSIEGNILRICYTMPGMGRPEDFTSLPGSNAYSIVWKREQP